MNIAVFLPNWIGDAVMATPALRALRRTFPDRRIIGVMKPYVAGALEGGDWFDEILLTHDGSWKKGIAASAWKLRRDNIESSVLFPNSLRSALVAWLAGSRRIVGYARYGRGPLLSDPLPTPRTPDGHIQVTPIIHAYNRLVEQIGCPPPGTNLELFTTPKDEQIADQVWQLGQFKDYSEIVCLNSGAAFGAAKHWPIGYFANLARKLIDRRNCAVLLLCGPAEKEQAALIAQQTDRPAVHSLAALVERAGAGLSLGLTKACVRRADLLVTTDSGPRHFAHAFDRPVVTLFGPTHIEWTETYHPRAIHLQKRLPCGPCQKRICPLEHHRCMKELLPNEVLQAAESLLVGA